MRKAKQEEKMVDATVIDEDILKSECPLRKAVNNYLAENKILQKDSQIDFGKIKVLSLSFLSTPPEADIRKIQYLESLTRLEKLQLDNNIILTIENIAHLTSLRWLDLSFNRIKRIEGLDQLVNLTDLSLFNNHIKDLEGLDACAKLNIFSIGNNLIQSFEEVITYFGRGPEKKTRFKYLQVLNVKGNPFTLKDKEVDREYEAHLIAHLPNLRYLDYVFIDERRRKEIREMDDKFKIEDQAKFLQELRIEEEKEREVEDEKRKKERAKMQLLDGFSEDIVRIDDLDKLMHMHGLEEETQKFTVKVKEVVEAMQKRIKEEHEHKLQEVAKSEVKLRQREQEAEARSSEALREFEKHEKALRKAVEARQPRWRDEVSGVRQKVGELRDTLLHIEVQLVEDADSLFKREITVEVEEYSKRILAILNEEQKDEKSEETGFFKKIEDEIKEFGNQLERITKEEIERFTTLQNSGENESEFSADPDLNSILENKETIPGMVSSIREMLLEKKSKKESEIEHELITKDKEAYKRHYDERQYHRNRNNVRNIFDKIDDLNRQLDQLVAHDTREQS